MQNIYDFHIAKPHYGVDRMLWSCIKQSICNGPSSDDDDLQIVLQIISSQRLTVRQEISYLKQQTYIHSFIQIFKHLIYEKQYRKSTSSFRRTYNRPNHRPRLIRWIPLGHRCQHTQLRRCTSPSRCLLPVQNRRRISHWRIARGLRLLTGGIWQIIIGRQRERGRWRFGINAKYYKYDTAY